jgi:hypothetical protein
MPILYTPFDWLMFSGLLVAGIASLLMFRTKD